MTTPLRIRPKNGKRLSKAERRFVKRNPTTRWAQKCISSPKLKRLRGVHWRWWALGQWALINGGRPEDTRIFLEKCDFLGIDWAVEEKYQTSTIKIA